MLCDFELRRNWRNTNEIAESTCVASLTPLPELSEVSGPQVRWVLLGPAKSERLALNEEVHDALAAGISPRDLVVLSLAAEKRAIFASGLTIAGLKSVPFDAQTPWQEGTIRCASVFRFKGLESRAIILTDISGFASDEQQMAAYVGMSRANTWLSVILSPAAFADLQSNRLRFPDLLGQSTITKSTDTFSAAHHEP
ncbi:hypothetical protein SDC9_155051 [bioreactor metagenome]|uniref:Uncharacterized protein n=1 Tax=bioreactor metagenome TaxID=1076179 RepID=A0A645F2Y7_9ZZZZ